MGLAIHIQPKGQDTNGELRKRTRSVYSDRSNIRSSSNIRTVPQCIIYACNKNAYNMKIM